MMEFGFRQEHYLLSKEQSTLNIERVDMQLKITNYEPNVCDLLSAHWIH